MFEGEGEREKKENVSQSCGGKDIIPRLDSVTVLHLGAKERKRKGHVYHT